MILITTKTCHNCAEAKNRLNAAGVEYELVYGEERPDIARKYKVMSVPALIDTENDGKKYVGVNEIIGFIQGRK